MILGNGIDIIEISRVQKVFEKNSSKLVEKLLSKEEIEEFNLLTDDKNRVFFLAKHFSIKEAIAKAIGCGINNEFLSFKNISITHNKFGKPILSNKNNAITDVIRKFFNTTSYEIFISISDESKFVVSNAIICEKSNNISDAFTTAILRK